MNWYDYIIPTHYVGAIVFGLVLTTIFALLAKREAGSWDKFFMTLASGSLTTFLIVFFLNKMGYF